MINMKENISGIIMKVQEDTIVDNGTGEDPLSHFLIHYFFIQRGMKCSKYFGLYSSFILRLLIHYTFASLMAPALYKTGTKSFSITE